MIRTLAELDHIPLRCVALSEDPRIARVEAQAESRNDFPPDTPESSWCVPADWTETGE